ncbi:hypothetical protein O988_02852 [Pseudogymnoascus sp. VKM F-3808]|nr:hypothetical protein O988_02852 [Pseudogymnoascus sp. VKM F-3808]
MSEQTSELKTYSGNCHCGAFKFNIQIPELQSFVECNCNTCSKSGYKWIFPDANHFSIVRGDGMLTVYDFGGGSMVHKFCPNCGTNVLGVLHGKTGGESVGINVRTLMGVDVWALESKPYDGAGTEPAYKPQEFAGPLPTADVPNPRIFTGSCHCGNVSIAVKAKPLPSKGQTLPEIRGPGSPFSEHTEYVQECSCSICMRNGTIFIYPFRPQVSISDPSNSLKVYMMGRKFQQHKFCSVCGVSMFIDKEKFPEDAAKWPDTVRSIWLDIVPVNLRILDDVDWDQLVVRKSDMAGKIEPKHHNNFLYNILYPYHIYPVETLFYYNLRQLNKPPSVIHKTRPKLITTPTWALRWRQGLAVVMFWKKPDNVAGTTAPAILIGLFVTFGGLLYGYDTGIISGIIATPWWLQQFATQVDPHDASKKALTPAQTAEVVSILSAGTFFGALAAAPLADQLGRRRALMIAVGVFSIGVTLQVASMALPLYVAGRFVAGVGVGMISVIVPLYQSEMAPKWVRGVLVCTYQLAITVGLLVAAIVEYFSNSIDTAASFQIPVALQYLWAGILVLGMIVLPETPRYLIKRGLHAEAAAALSRIRRLDITHPALVDEIAEIEANHAYEISLGPSTYRDVFFGSPHLGRRLLTGCGLFMLQQLSGCNFIFYFGNSFFNKIIGSGFLFQVVANCVNVIGTLPGIVFVESLGRRRLLMAGAVSMATCQLIVAAVGSVNGLTSDTSNKLYLAFVYIYIFTFASTWGPVCWVVTAEIFPLKVRAKSMSISTSSNWLLNFVIAYATPYLLGSGPGSLDLGPKIFYVWGVCCVFAFFFVWIMVYETSKLTLEQIDEMYERVGRAWKSQSFEPTWSFQNIRQGTQANTTAVNVTAVDFDTGEELRQRTGATTASSNATGDTIRTSGEVIESSPSTTQSATHVTDEDKIVASLGNIDFSL